MAQVDAQGLAVLAAEGPAGFLRGLRHQRVEVGQRLAQLRGAIAHVLGNVADDAGGARRQQARGVGVGIEQRTAREAGRHRAVFARVLPGRGLARVFQRHGRCARAQRHHLQASRFAVGADRSGGRRRVVEHAINGARAADAEAAVALVVAIAQVDRGEIVPDAQQVGVFRRPHGHQQALVGQGGGGFDVAFGLVHDQRDHGVVLAVGPGGAAGFGRFAHRAGQPAFGRGARQAGTVHRQRRRLDGPELEGDQGLVARFGHNAQAGGGKGLGGHCWARL